MKKIILFTILSIISAVVLFSQDARIRLAVCEFNDTITRETELNKNGTYLSSSVEKLYSLANAFKVRESSALTKYLDNMKSVQLGLTDDLLFKGSGDSLLVDYLVIGTVSSIDGKYNVDARIVNVDSWKILKSCGTTSGSLDEAIEDIKFNLIESFDQAYITDRENFMEKSPTVAIFSFKDENPAAMYTKYSSVFVEMLNSVLGSFQMTNTIERTYTKTLIQEKVLEMVGVTENNASNRKDVIGIQYKVTGGIRVFKDVTTINYKIENISTGQVIYIGSRDIASSSALRRVAQSIALIIDDVLGNKISSIKINSNPPGAEVYLDDELMGVTPLLAPVQKGNHKLIVKLAGYEPFKSDISVEAQTIFDKTVKLEPLSTKLYMEAYQFEVKGDFESALKGYDEFINTYGDAVEVNDALYRKGHILIGLKRYNEAVQTFEILVKRYPDSLMRAQAYYGLALAYYSMGNLQKAVEMKNYLYEHFGETETFTVEEAKRTFNF